MSMSWYWPTRNGRPPSVAVVGVIVISALLVISATTVEISFSKIIQSMPRMFDFMRHLLVEPDWGYLPQLVKKMLQTLEMTLLGTAIAVFISMPIGILAAKNSSPHPLIYRAMRDILSFIRALPELVWALVFVSAVGLGPLPGVMALAFVTVGFMGKFIADSIEVVSPRAIEGLNATGCTHLQSIFYAMLPQAVPDFIGSLLYILDHNLRAAAVLGLVGAGGIGYDMVMSMRLFNYERIFMIAFSIYLLVTLLDRLSDILRQRAIGKVFNDNK
ncbi:MAG: phosphonate ABC transporter, permease protein PhnE [Methyloprofundus sp.]|nr:phosphonate ABC transporter, permease protein PhnE [Methyloprofundus sp.]